VLHVSAEQHGAYQLLDTGFYKPIRDAAGAVRRHRKLDFGQQAGAPVRTEIRDVQWLKCWRGPTLLGP